ncbi:MAG: SDR family oxidoreductase [Propionibacteriaceae bacterium]|jgi:NAD(P)-dependent dehydrogenase (short-subunit alcohol dehydrogenase family)|nr:SDR family oxidoreductase [Propionibacteriaceae bacterium]
MGIVKKKTKAEIDAYGLAELGWDRVPTDIVEKSVTALMDLKGKKAIVTGAGGYGLGQACANRLASLGADVALVGHSSLERTEANAEVVRRRWNAKAIAVVGELTDYADTERVFAECHERLGGIDILINNSVAVSVGDFAAMSPAAIDHCVAGSFTMLTYCCRVVLDYMMPQRSGRIINISSIGGRAYHPNIALYNACKAGVIGLTRTLGAELISHGIRVNGVCPGVMLHDNLRAAFENPTDDPHNFYAREAVIQGFEYAAEGRVSLPEEVANMVAFLCTDAATYIVGQNFNHAGGQVLL